MHDDERQEMNSALRKPPPGRWRDVRKHFKAMQFVMSQNEEMRRKWWKIENCSAYRPCNQSECLHCGAGVPFREYPQKPDYMRDMIAEEFLRGRSRNFRSNAGHGVERVFDRFDDDEVFAVTLGIHFGTKNMNCTQVHRLFRRRFKAFMKKEMPDAVVYLVADVAAEKTSSFALDWPDTDRDNDLDDPDVKAGLFLHAHGFVGDSGLTEGDLRRVLKKFIPGARRVEIGEPQDVTVDDKGRLRGGYEGYLEYAAMEKYDLDLPDGDPEYDNVAMFEAINRARMAWPRNARKTKINHRHQPSSSSHPANYSTPSNVDADSEIIRLPLHMSISAPYKWSNVENGPVALVSLMEAIGLDVTFCGRSIRVQLHDLDIYSGKTGQKTAHRR